MKVVTNNLLKIGGLERKAVNIPQINVDSKKQVMEGEDLTTHKFGSLYLENISSNPNAEKEYRSHLA
jgi:hypothetical protein